MATSASPCGVVRSSFLSLLAMLLFAIAPVAQAQEASGSIRGVVTDPSGAVVAGATITLENSGTGNTWQLKTRGDGQYLFELVWVGQYVLRIETPGFSSLTLTNITVSVGQNVVVNAQVKLPTAEQQVTVSAADVPLVDTTSMSHGDVIDSRRVVELPLNGRNFLQLALLTAGVATAPEGGATETYGTAASNVGFVVGGTRDLHNNYNLDGVSVLDRDINYISINPSIDAIQEFKVLDNSYSSESGILPGAQVNIVTKSGTNHWHGSLFEFVRNSAFDAKNYFDDPDRPIPGFTQNQFGGALGGPIRKNKTFFFVDYEGLRIRQSLTNRSMLPTQAMRNGDLNGINPGTGLPFPPIINPATGLPFLGNQIPASMIDPLSAAILAITPLPNLPAVPPGVNNQLNVAKRRANNDQFTVRVDHLLTSRHQLFGRYTFQDSSIFEPFTTNTLTSNPQAPPGFGSNHDDFARNLGIGLTSTFTPQLVNDFRFGYSLLTGFRESENIHLGFLDSVGISRGPRGSVQGGVPTMSIPGFANIGDPDVFQPRDKRNETFQIKDELVWNRGKHALHIGAEFRRYNFDYLVDFFSQGAFIFNDGPGSVTGNAFADFLLGRPFLGLAYSGTGKGPDRSHYFGTFFHDEYRVSRRLTLNYGVRWEFTTPNQSTEGRAVGFDERTGAFIVASEDGSLPTEINDPLVQFFITAFGTQFRTTKELGLPMSIVPTDYGRWAPRFGLAFDVFGNSRTVLRASYGIYNATRDTVIASFLRGNVPYGTVLSTLDLARFGVPIPPATFQQAYLTGNQPPSVNALLPYTQDGYVHRWTLDIQQQLTRDLMLQVSYIGSSGIHLNHLSTPGQALPNLPGLRRGFTLNPGYSPNFTDRSDATSSYNAGIIGVEKRASHGLLVSGSYTFSKSIDTASSTVETSGAFTREQDAYNLRAERGLSSFNARHRFVMSALWSLPVRPHSGLAKTVLGDWQIGGILTLQSGQPLTPQMPTLLSGTQQADDRPDVVCNPNLPSDQRTPTHWFDTGCIAPPPIFFDAFGPFSIPGNAGRNIIEGPGLKVLDMTIEKMFTLAEGHTLRFRSEFFNLPNHPNFQFPGRIFGTSNFGRVTAARASRQIQFSLRYSF